MADDNEDDLFADLYDNDEPAPTKQEPVPATVTPAAVPAALPEIATDPAAIAPDNLQNGDQSIPTAVGDGHMQTPGAQVPSWQGNENSGDVSMGGDVQAAAEESRPIGIKEDGKMFVGGLNWETTDESLKNYFTQFGEVAECTVMRDAATGRSRGFGFLTFRDPKDVNLVMVKEHHLDGKIIDPKRAIPRDEQERTAKIFVGGVSQDATEEDFKNYFSQYGRVIDATLMMDKDTGRPRGFGFVTFDSEQAVDNTLRGDLNILGKPIEVKKAQPRGNIKEEENHGVRGRRGGGRGAHDGFDQGGGAMGVGAAAMGGNPMQQAGMTPQMMALWWQQMQGMMRMYMANGSGNMMGGNNMGQMNPQMMQQMYMQMQQKNGGGMGGPQAGNNSPMAGMTPAGMGQANGGNNSPMPNAPTGPSGSAQGAVAGNGLNAQQQQMFEQQKYEQQNNAGYGQQQGQWDGMYDENGNGGGNMMGQDGGQQQQGGNGFQQGGGFQPGGRGRGRFRGRGGAGGGHFHDKQPPSGPSNAPAGAPTGPKNAGPAQGYRGGRGGRGGGFHPYRR